MTSQRFLAFVITVIGIWIPAYGFHNVARVGRQGTDPTSPATTTTLVPTIPTTTLVPTGPTTTLVPTGPTTTLVPTTLNPVSTTLPPVVPAGGTVILNPGDIRSISNSGFVRFGRGLNNGGQILTWRFLANNCRLDATCPCLGIPASWNCLDGYLKLRTGVLWDRQRFCGGNRPNGFTSDSGELDMRYKSSSDPRSTGFTCFVSCTAYGQMRPALPVVVC